MAQKVDTSKPYVEVTLEDGEQQIKAVNFAGKGCVEAVGDIQKILGGEVQSTHSMPEAKQATIHKPAVVRRK